MKIHYVYWIFHYRITEFFYYESLINPDVKFIILNVNYKYNNFIEFKKIIHFLEADYYYNCLIKVLKENFIKLYKVF